MARWTLWYDTPAADWEREALPIGNGTLGAMVFGGVARERIQFNEKSLWTGGPGGPGSPPYDHGNWREPRPGALAAVQRLIDEHGAAAPEDVAARLGRPRSRYGAYQTFGDLWLEIPGAPESPDGYRRRLDIRQGVALVEYTAQGARHQREFFASYPDRVIVGRLGAAPGPVGFTLRHTSPRPGDHHVTARDGRLTIRGALEDNGLRFEAQVRVVCDGGTVTAGEDGTLTVTGAHSAWFVLAAGTDYADTHPHYRGEDPHRAVTETVDAAASQGWLALLSRHVRDHRALFDRTALDLGGRTPPGLPTDRQRAAYTGGESPADRALEELFFDYGRYLLIASSRPGAPLPANLQGVWNDSIRPAWSADYHTNINLQMTYWPAHALHLAETAEPLHRFITALRIPGRITAREMFGARGWVVHNETNPYGFTGVHDWPTAFWFPEAAAWLVHHLYEHYRFTLDTGFLRDTAYPAMREAAAFWLDTLRPDPRDGTLVVSPGYSPEHGDFTAGPAMSQQIVHDLLTATLEAARTLGDDPAFQAGLRRALDALDPGLRIGSWGQLQEWKADLDDPADTHRHASHLFALHPGRQIAPNGPWAGAAAVSLDARGDGGTGWSRAWKVNFWARLRDGDRAHRLLAGQLTDSTLPNLWDTHPPFQIDGNFGAAAGIAQMLLQSHRAVLEVLPALPRRWPDGSVRGLRAHGDLTVDITWREGRARSLTVTAGHDGPVRIRSDLFARPYTVHDGTTGRKTAVRDDPGDARTATLAARGGHTYRFAERT
ncbi:glycoside hydrolase N-terminal domain-containing protein [Streptomyces sp. Rer75]|uniref:glycoside hydrolase family 95 protein n=1 Tax=Streptomyces sp. Rer75 TaxID=2750011 RepID=UPI0015D07D14|nr:glycoside hydrolase family 95 protein [Streptomyces sp. Rer75]QLH20277.1 glycoside hydrolase family 95 protein [Streptomyces sp. Rer75]